MTKYREYFTLLSRDSVRDMWQIEFGDYDRSVVVAERDDYRNHYKAINLHIIVTDHTGVAIQARVDALNANTMRRTG